MSWGPETGIREMLEACLFFLQFFKGALCIFDLGTWSEFNTLAEGKEFPEQRATPEPDVGCAPLLLTQGKPTCNWCLCIRIFPCEILGSNWNLALKALSIFVWWEEHAFLNEAWPLSTWFCCGCGLFSEAFLHYLGLLFFPSVAGLIWEFRPECRISVRTFAFSVSSSSKDCPRQLSCQLIRSLGAGMGVEAGSPDFCSCGLPFLRHQGATRWSFWFLVSLGPCVAL